MPGDEPQQRRLAGAVAADEPDRLARLGLERDVPQRPHVVVAERPRATTMSFSVR